MDNGSLTTLYEEEPKIKESNIDLDSEYFENKCKIQVEKIYLKHGCSSHKSAIISVGKNTITCN